METVALLALLEAKPGKEGELEAFLADALPLALAEAETVSWYALKLGPRHFAIFDTFANQRGRDVHLSGPIASALLARADDLLAEPPRIEQAQLLAVKSAATRS